MTAEVSCVAGAVARMSFHEPKTPADAASEFVRAMAFNQADVTDRLACLGRPSFGSWPVAFGSPGSDTRPRFYVSRVLRTERAKWHVTVAVRTEGGAPGFHVDTTVVKNAEHFRVCTAASR